MAKSDAWLKPDNLLRIEGWARDGLTDQQIAHNMGITQDTLIKWKRKFPQINESLKFTKEVVDREVENALYKNACGYEYEEETWERKRDPETGLYEMVQTKRVKKIVPPNTTAQIFWLKNRKPDVWRDKREIESTEAIDRLDMILGEMKFKANLQEGAEIDDNKPIKDPSPSAPVQQNIIIEQ